MTQSKRFTATLILNWKTGVIKVRKRTPKKNIGGYDIPINLNLTVNIPEPLDIVAAGEITLPQAKVDKMMIVAIDEATKGDEE